MKNFKNEVIQLMNQSEKQTEIANFFTREHSNLVRYLRMKINDLSEMEIEDVISDIMLNFFNNTGIINQIQNLTGYINQSLYHKAIDYLRKRKRLVSLNDTITDDSDKTFGELLADRRFDIHDEISARELKAKLYQTLDQLDPRQRAVWIATEIEGYSFRELALQWNEPIGTLLARKHRAAEALKKALADLKP